MVKIVNQILIFLFFSSFISCKSPTIKTERAFYYWKNSKYSLDKNELLCLKNNAIQKLYVKFFEVDYDAILGAIPTAKTELHIWNYASSFSEDSIFNATMSNLEIIPTVYIKNKTLLSQS